MTHAVIAMPNRTSAKRNGRPRAMRSLPRYRRCGGAGEEHRSARVVREFAPQGGRCGKQAEQSTGPDKPVDGQAETDQNPGKRRISQVLRVNAENPSRHDEGEIGREGRAKPAHGLSYRGAPGSGSGLRAVPWTGERRLITKGRQATERLTGHGIRSPRSGQTHHR